MSKITRPVVTAPTPNSWHPKTSAKKVFWGENWGGALKSAASRAMHRPPSTWSIRDQRPTTWGIPNNIPVNFPEGNQIASYHGGPDKMLICTTSDTSSGDKIQCCQEKDLSSGKLGPKTCTIFSPM